MAHGLLLGLNRRKTTRRNTEAPIPLHGHLLALASSARKKTQFTQWRIGERLPALKHGANQLTRNSVFYL
jgi:hypothetical protein